MICLHCRQTITDANRQTYKGGLRLPYCKPCTDAFNKKNQPSEKNAAALVQALTPAQKRKAHKIAKRKLMHNLQLTETEAEEELKKRGL